MALSDQDLSLALLSNPTNIQKEVLDDVLARYGNTYDIVDPNNVAMHLIEMASSLTSNFAGAAESAIASGNALRAQTTEELAKHMSDYDYVNMYSTPASTYLLLTLDKRYLHENAVAFNTNYKKVIIPKDTIFSIGDIKFGIYYPIEIRINSTTGACLVVFDTSNSNPLHELNQNIVAFTEQKYLHTSLLILKIPVYQFSRSIITEDLLPDRGFAKKYTHTDKFYAVRLFTTVNNQRVELAQSLAIDTYDPYTPTARLQISPETNQFSINVPQVYFTAGKMGPQLSIEVFTTKGEMDMDVSAVPSEAITCNFNTTIENSVYSKILNTVPTVILAMSSDKIVGGSNGLSFEEKRTRVINNAFHTSVLVTPMDMEKYFQDTGFSIFRYKDNLTNLIYFAYKILTDKNKSVIPAMTAYIDLREEIVDTVSTILKNLDGTITILPKTLYKYSNSTQTCVPVDDTDRNRIATLTKKELVNEFNNELYTRSPFHIRLIPDGRYPKVASYNLLDPELTDIKFEKENSNITAQMVATAGTIIHSNEGSGGYKVQFIVNKSTDLTNVPEEALTVYMYTTSIEGVLIGTKLDYVGQFTETDAIYECQLGTDYYISRDHQLNMTTLKDNSTIWDHLVNLSGQYQLVFLVEKSYFPTAVTVPSLYTGITQTLQSTHMVMLRQSCNIRLGYSLEDVVYNDINLSWAGREYERHPVDVPMLYTTDIYETDADGVPIVNVDPDTQEVTLNKIHSIGDPILDEYGEPTLKHRAGDIRYDDFGNPIVVTDRVKIYYINAMMIDAKLYLSEHPTQIEYRRKFSQTLESYFSTLRAATDKLPERDLLYFRPTRTMGNAKFGIGDSVVVSMLLNMSIRFKCHVASNVVADDELKETITNTIVAMIESIISTKESVSLTEMCTSIKDAIDYIEYIDVLGINDDTELQTITVMEDGVQPSIAQELYLTKDNQLAIRKAVDVEYVVVD